MALKDKLKLNLGRTKPVPCTPSRGTFHVDVTEGRSCPCCFSTLLADERRTPFMTCWTPTGRSFPYRLCAACTDLVGFDASWTSDQMRLGMAVTRARTSDLIQIGAAFDGEA